VDPTTRAITFALTRDETAQPALLALRGADDPAVVEAIVELLHRPHTAAARLAVEILAERDHPLVAPTLIYALESPLSSVRKEAIEALARRREYPQEELSRRLREDPSWPVRRAALHALAQGDVSWAVLDAADDPHWRVRHALLGILAPMTDHKDEIRARLAARAPRIAGMRRYLDALWEGDWTPQPSVAMPPVWLGHDPDPAVLLRNLKLLSPAGCRASLDAIVATLGHDDERVARRAGEIVRRHGGPSHLVEVLGWLEDPRSNAGPGLSALLTGLDLDRIEEAARRILHDESPSPRRLAWAIEQIGSAFPVEELAIETLPLIVREAIDRRQGVRHQLERPETHSLARAAALTLERAAEIVANPDAEPSWHVVACAARLCRVPLWRFEPQPAWEPTPVAVASVESVEPILRAPPHARRLGALRVSPVGLSGHYGLPVEGFVAGVEAGINVLFWEPSYTTLTSFSSRLWPTTRRDLHFMAGTFEATPKRVRADAERALRRLRIDRVALFVLYWTRNWDRLDDDLRSVLDDLKREGKVQTTMVSTHDRTLAVEAIAGGYDPVMVRHSAAHRSAERAVFPRAVEAGASVITFNNTCYGRLLRPRGDRPAPSAADCYRYSLSQPGVSMCLSAPATVAQLADTLAVVRDPVLSEERRAHLIAWGDELYREEKLFQQTIRSR
jgi:HEAT repeats